MQGISQYISEARKSVPVEIEYTPKDKNELIKAILEVTNAQSRRKVLDFNCIDTSAVTSMGRLFLTAAGMTLYDLEDFHLHSKLMSKIEDALKKR